MGAFKIIVGDVEDVLPELDGPFDAVLCDPPYGLKFMGCAWDTFSGENRAQGNDTRADFDQVGGNHNPSNSKDRQRTRLSEGRKFQEGALSWFEAILPLVRPGAYVAAFGGTRTYHRLACAIEDAGFEIRDCLSWLYGSGFPKSLDVSKAIDKAAGAERKKIGTGKGRTGAAAQPNGGSVHSDDNYQWPGDFDITAPSTEAARHWDGYGTALKPAWEPCVLAMKPLDGTFAANALEHGVAGLNVDGGRIESHDGYTENAVTQGVNTARTSFAPAVDRRMFEPSVAGRWPANVALDEEAAAMLDEQSGVTRSRQSERSAGFVDSSSIYGTGRAVGKLTGANDEGGASRFFYTAKVSTAERNAGLQPGDPCRHPTLKPVRLMEWLAKLLLPPPREDGKPRRLLVPFSGAGSEVAGALRAGWDEVVGIEQSAEYAAWSRLRVPALERMTFEAATRAPVDLPGQALLFE